MSLTIAVCDSDKNICEDIAHLIRRQRPEARIFLFRSKEELLAAAARFSILFLDVQGVSGLEIARELRRREEEGRGPRSILIFVTGYREYMEEAFDVRAFHYLLKPIRPEKFRQVLEAACREAQQAEAQAESFLLLKTQAATVKLALQDIFFIDSSNKKVLVHTEGETYEVYGTMEAMELALGAGFFRCHRCFLVNLSKVASYTSDAIFLTGGRTVLLSRKKYGEFVKAFLRYAREGGIVDV